MARRGRGRPRRKSPPTAISAPILAPVQLPDAYFTEHTLSGPRSPGMVEERHEKVSQACEHCRSRKLRCDKTKPCQTCASKGRECFYNLKRQEDNFEGRVIRAVQRLDSSGRSLLGLLSNFITPGLAPEPWRPGWSSMPKNHTALPGLLLQCPPIANLVRPVLSQEQIESCENLHLYQERERRLLLDDGRGDAEHLLDFRASYVRALAHSFNDHVMNMHPLLSLSEVNALVAAFLAEKDAATGRSGRGRPPADDPPAGSWWRPTRTMETTLVFLIFAIGEACQKHVAEKSGVQPLPPTPSSTGGWGEEEEVVPGLGYYAVACEFLGGQVGGNRLIHVHAHLLAGLYHGMLGRVMESWAHIRTASTVVQLLIEPCLSRFQKPHVETESGNRLVIAYWSCLQLENEILGELRLPPSGITDYEQVVPLPAMQISKDCGIHSNVAATYFSQIFLRRQLNAVYGLLYRPGVQEPEQLQLAVSRLIAQQQEAPLENRLAIWEWAPRVPTAESSERPPGDVLGARLRAQYWAAEAVALRPFISWIIAANYHAAVGGGGGDDPYISPQVLDLARRGVVALVESTRAFHGLRRHVITPNVWVTAHAHWGNLITLVAVQMDPVLGREVDVDVLRELFRETIAFFRLVARPSSALCTDLEMLEHLAVALGPREGPVFIPAVVDDHDPEAVVDGGPDLGGFSYDFLCNGIDFAALRGGEQWMAWSPSQ